MCVCVCECVSKRATSIYFAFTSKSASLPGLTILYYFILKFSKLFVCYF